MKKIYLLALTGLVFTGCSKDFLKRYEKRIEGSWRLSDIDRRGLGGSIGNLRLQEGDTFVFSEDGELTYTNTAGEVYEGDWDIRREWIRGRCYTDADGDYSCDDRRVKSLSIVAVDFVSQDVQSEYFDEIQFTGTNRFNAFIYSGAHTYIFRFRR